MALFGWLEMRKANSEEPPKQALPVNPHRQIGIDYTPFGAEVRGQNIELFKLITWPDAHRLNPFEAVAFQKEIVDFSKNLAEDGFFSICAVKRLLELCKVKITPETTEIIKNLQHLHCVKYRNMPPDILARLPMMMSGVFTSGASLKDIPNYQPPKPAKDTVKMIRVRDGVSEEFDVDPDDVDVSNDVYR